MTRSEDEVQAERARSGDREAFARVAIRWWPAVYRLAWNMLGTEPRAAAAAEATLLLVLRFRGDSWSDRSFRTALYGVAIDVLLLLRRPWNGPDDAEEAPDAPERVRGLLGRLDPLDCAAFLLREIEELPVDEVAIVLRTSVAGTCALVHRATLQLQGMLAPLPLMPPCSGSPTLRDPAR